MHIENTCLLFFDQDYIDGTRRYSENPTEENARGIYNGSLRFYGYNNYQDLIITEWAPQTKYDFSISGASEKPPTIFQWVSSTKTYN